ncbi:MAG: transposase, partial [Roseovarius sp.]|nr:transposase [Roseovarius sp.]
MADHSIMSQVEVLSVTDTGRRRRWTDAEKLRIVEESYAGPRMVAATSRRHELSRALLTRWRREAREGLLAAEGDRAHFAPVAVMTDPAPRSVTADAR